MHDYGAEDEVERRMARMVAQVVAHADNLLEIILTVSLTRYIVIVLLIHHGDIVKTRKVL